jgi:threonylcarbamoyladenosine tRNA methylthiotransferase MtaB
LLDATRMSAEPATSPDVGHVGAAPSSDRPPTSLPGQAGPATRVSFVTLGCRLNQADTHQLQALLEARGYRTVSNAEQADVVVVNTCAVTARAELSDRQAIRRAARLRPEARIVVTGCWAQTDPDAVAALARVDLVIGNSDKARLPELLAATAAGQPRPRVEVTCVAGGPLTAVAPRPHPHGRARAFLKVQDGCQHRCAFCIVPRARGGSRSLEPAVVEAQVRGLVEVGHPEIVLTGVDLGHYGADLRPRTSLAALLVRLTAVPGLRWLRLSSLLPAYFTEELLDVVTTSPVIAPHLHLPLQSGSDRVLRSMRRPYTAGMYRRVVERLAAAIPRLGLGADLLVGFPGETAGDFAATLALVEALPFSYLHVFPFSARAGTEAARLAGRVPASTVTARARALRELGAVRGRRFREAMIGRLEEALVLETRDRVSGRLVGLTGNFVEVAFAGPDRLRGGLARVRLTAVGERTALGVLEDAQAA